MRSNQGSGAHLRRRRLIRRVTFASSSMAVVAFLMVVTTLATLVSTSRPAAAAQHSEGFAFNGGESITWTVPPGVTEAQFDIAGGQGGRGADHEWWAPPDGVLGGGRGGAGGHGAVIRAWASVTPGDTYTLVVGGNGGYALGSSGRGLGANGFCAYASNGEEGAKAGGAGGGGGGATALYHDGSLVAVAGGGGGGGGGGHELEWYTGPFHGGGGGDAGYFGNQNGTGGSGPGETPGGSGGSTPWCGGTNGGDAFWFDGGGGGGGGGAGVRGGEGGGEGRGGGGGGGGGAGSSHVSDSWANRIEHPSEAPSDGYVRITYDQIWWSRVDVYDQSGPVTLGAPVVVQAELVTASSASSAHREGTITWKVGSHVLGTQNHVHGVEPFSIPGLAPGGHTITAEFTPRFPNEMEPSSGSVDVQVNRGNAAVVIFSGPDPSVHGQPVTLSATVNAVAPTPGAPSGQVQFAIDGVPHGSPAPLDASGRANLRTDALPVGVHTITAAYSGDDAFLPSPGSSHTHVVNHGDVSVTSSSDITPSIVDDLVTLTADVEAVDPAAGVPSGSVTFNIGGVDRPAATLSASGRAQLQVLDLEAGIHEVIATYGGDDAFKAASGTATHVVDKGELTVSISQSADSSMLHEVIGLTATLEPRIEGRAAPTGLVEFYVNGNHAGSGSVDTSGIARLSTSVFAPGTNVITARYTGDRAWSDAYGGPLDHLVAAADEETTPSAPSQPTQPPSDVNTSAGGDDQIGAPSDATGSSPTSNPGHDAAPGAVGDGEAEVEAARAGEGFGSVPLPRTGEALFVQVLIGAAALTGGLSIRAGSRRREQT